MKFIRKKKFAPILERNTIFKTWIDAIIELCYIFKKHKHPHLSDWVKILLKKLW